MAVTIDETLVNNILSKIANQASNNNLTVDDLLLLAKALDYVKQITDVTNYDDAQQQLVTLTNLVNSADITKQGNVFNAANKLMKFLSDGKYPSGDGSNIFNTTAALPRLYKSGFEISMNSTFPTRKIDIAPGACRSIQDNFDIKLLNTITVDINDTVNDRGGVIANGTFPYIFIISDGTNVKGWIDSSNTAANRPSAYTYYRRIGAINYIDSTNGIRGFIQSRNQILWLSAVNDIDTTDTTYSNQIFTCTSPSNISIAALLGGWVGNNSVNAYPYLYVKPKNCGANFIAIVSANVGGCGVGATPVPITTKDAQLHFTFGGNSNRRGVITNYGFEDYFID